VSTAARSNGHACRPQRAAHAIHARSHEGRSRAASTTGPAAHQAWVASSSRWKSDGKASAVSDILCAQRLRRLSLRAARIWAGCRCSSAVSASPRALAIELADPELSPRQRGARISALAATDHAFEGRRVEVTGPTLRRWLRAWRSGGFAGLVPAVRRQPNRTPAELLEAGEALKREAPKRTAVQVARALAEAGLGKVSDRTIQRHFARLGLDVRPDGQPPRALGRFQADEFGELWTGDGMHGPVVGAAKAILFPRHAPRRHHRPSLQISTTSAWSPPA